MKVKAKSLKNRTKTGLNRQSGRPTTSATRRTNTEINPTITSRIKRPDIVNAVAQTNAAYAGRRDTRSNKKTRTASSSTKTRVGMYSPPGVQRKQSTTTIYWVLGGVAAVVLLISFIAIIVSSSSDNTPVQQPVATTVPSGSSKKTRTKFKNYGPGSWASDPEKRAQIESSQLYKNRQDMKKNYQKDR